MEYTNRGRKYQKKKWKKPTGGVKGPRKTVLEEPKNPSRKMPKIRSKYAGICSLCQQEYEKDTWISKWGSHWNHTECCQKELDGDFERSRDKHSHKANDYRRGKSPGSYR